MEKAVAEVSGFSCGYRRGVAVVRDASAVFGRGSLTAIVGPNGAGKSSLLRGMAGLMPWTDGVGRLCGERLQTFSRREVARMVALVASKSETPGITVADYALLGRTPYRSLVSLSDSRADRDKVAAALEMLGLAFAKDALMTTLSDGQRQMAGLARAMVQEPRLLLLDEPTANLDPRNAENVLSAVRHIARSQGIAAVAVLHDVNAARRWAERAIVMKRGRVLLSGAAADVLTADALSDAYDTPFEVGTALVPARNTPV